MAQIKIEITYDPSTETLEQAVSSLTPNAAPTTGSGPAFTIEAAIAAQRFIAADQVDSYVEYLKNDLKLTPKQIEAVCGEYVSANSALLQASAESPTASETSAPAKNEGTAASETAGGKPSASPSEPGPEPKKVSKTDVRAVATALSKAGKREELSAIFAEFGGKKLSDIKEEDYPTLMERLVAANG